MFPVWIAAWALLAPPEDQPALQPVPPADAASLEAAPTDSPKPLRQRVHSALRSTSGAVRKDASLEVLTQAACELLPLYDELRRAVKMEETDRLQLGGIIRGRLKKIEKKLDARLADLPAGASVPVQVRIESSASQGGNGSVDPQTGDLAANQGGRSVEDNGRALVELIQSTIAPSSWDVNGGPGSIMYYPPLRVLVVRASGEVQGNVGGVLGQLQGD